MATYMFTLYKLSYSEGFFMPFPKHAKTNRRS